MTVLYAIEKQSGFRTDAYPGAKCLCPQCGETVVPKCGEIVTWHFAHESREDCDPWSEPESEWHRWWKEQAQPHQREVTIGNHRADIVSASGKRVIELQHSPISVEVIREREMFYQRTHAMIWVFDVRDCEDRITLSQSKFRQNEVFGIWKWARKTLQHISCPLYLDIYGGNSPLYRVKKWKGQVEGLPQAFVARRVDRADFVYRFIQKMPGGEA